MPDGYYHHPTIYRDIVVFVSEDDLWSVPAKGGRAERLTANLGEISTPLFSPDGQWIAFVGKEEGPPDAFLMPARGGSARRLTYLGGSVARIAGWRPDSKAVFISSNAHLPFGRFARLLEVPIKGGLPRELRLGPATAITHGPHGARALQRFGLEPAWWKRYRGGRAPVLLIDPTGRGIWRPLLQLKGQRSNPMWMGSHIYFLSDHEGVANLYSCTPDGRALKRHSDHTDFYVRNATTDGQRIVYHAGGDLWLFDGRRIEKIAIDFPSPRIQRNRKYIDAAHALEDYAPHEKSIALTTRGHLFTMAPFDGPVEERGVPRLRLARWLHDGKRLAAITDDRGEEALILLPSQKRIKANIGRTIDMIASPTSDQLALANHRHELILADLKTGHIRILDRSPWDRIAGMAWSPDGRWLAYGIAQSASTFALKLADTKSARTHILTRPVLRDVAPAFDPDGRYLYFLSYREFDPVYDNLHFDLGFPRGVKPYLITLRKDLRSPFNGEPLEAPPKEAKKKQKFTIDLDGIEERIVAFPVPEGKYAQIEAISGAALWTVWPIEGSLNHSWLPSEPLARGVLEKYDLAKRKKETLVNGVSSFRIGGKNLVYRTGSRLRWLKAGEKPDEKTDRDPPGRESGWLDLARVRVLVEPATEWAQMFREAWRLMRDHFWVEDMSGVDWKRVYERYRPLVERVGSRSEFSDLVWEMQGELGTSHCYEFGGDYRPEPRYDLGHLGADFSWTGKGYRIDSIIRGDSWDERASSPLCAPGVGVREGDTLVAINGNALSATVTPHELLLHRAESEVVLTLSSGRAVAVKTLRDETRARYRDWVERNRRRVHKETKGRVGYVHVPDMGPAGFAEFHRGYLAEVHHDALVVDVRNNGGGHVSQLLLEKLARQRVGYDVNRWGQPIPYPQDSPRGPLVAITNEGAGSDGDIFSHCFKLYKLGPLIGRRTWGGVIGIWPRHALADGSVTSQPEFSFWFRDVGFGVENYGTDPDIDVDILPHDYARGRDPQLEKGIEVALSLLAKHKPLVPAV